MAIQLQWVKIENFKSIVSCTLPLSSYTPPSLATTIREKATQLQRFNGCFAAHFCEGLTSMTRYCLLR